MKLFKIRHTTVFAVGAAVLIVTSITGSSAALAWPWSGSPEVRALEKLANSNFDNLTRDCFSYQQQNNVLKTGAARSDARIQAINKFYSGLVAKKCLKNAKGDFFINPYFGVNLSKLASASYLTYDYELYQGILYDADYGFSPFTASGTICSDGTMSSSTGQGTCSWHGGYATPRGTRLDFEKNRELERPGKNEYSELGNLSIQWTGGYPSEMKKPVPYASIGQKGFSCVQSAGFTTNCFHVPQFAFNFCSSDKSGLLQFKVGKEWKLAWDVYGFKILNNCPKDTPYLFEVTGQSLIPGSFRVLFPDKTDIKFQLTPKI